MNKPIYIFISYSYSVQASAIFFFFVDSLMPSFRLRSCIDSHLVTTDTPLPPFNLGWPRWSEHTYFSLNKEVEKKKKSQDIKKLIILMNNNKMELER